MAIITLQVVSKYSCSLVSGTEKSGAKIFQCVRALEDNSWSTLLALLVVFFVLTKLTYRLCHHKVRNVLAVYDHTFEVEEDELIQWLPFLDRSQIAFVCINWNRCFAGSTVIFVATMGMGALYDFAVLQTLRRSHKDFSPLFALACR